jgi:hypothetical protein
MASSGQKNIVSRLADAGEEAIQRLADAPGADRFVGAMTSMRERMDDMQKKLRGLDALDARMTKVERRLDKLEGTKSASSTRRVASTTAKRSSAKKPATKSASAGSGSSSRSSSSGARRSSGES